jgi:mono/diheme cytochrome c family protein
VAHDGAETVGFDGVEGHARPDSSVCCAAVMPRRLIVLVSLLAAGAFAACGEKGIQLSESNPDYEGAKIFEQRCSGCHTLDAAGTQGSAVNVNSREYKDGPNFNQRAESKEQILYAIYNGGFSSGPMPQDIVVGEDAEKVADFVAKYSGGQAARTDVPDEDTEAPEGTEPEGPVDESGG